MGDKAGYERSSNGSFRNAVFSNAVRFIESLFLMIDYNQLRLEKITEERFKEAWQMRKKFQDKPDISFTDLTSFVLMQELEISKVFTGDSYFGKTIPDIAIRTGQLHKGVTKTSLFITTSLNMVVDIISQHI